MNRLANQIGCESMIPPQHANSSLYCPSVTIDGDFFYSHPKLKQLEDIVLKHFREQQAQTKLHSESLVAQSHTRVMIFSQYRESVREIADMLSQHTPMVRVMSFMGQASTGKNCKGQTQREQIEV